MSSPREVPAGLDEAVFAAAAGLGARQVIQPAALVLSATGLGILPGRLRDGRRLPLGALEGVPAPWRESLLHHGRLQGMTLWMLDDARAGEPAGEPPWVEGFPVWLAAAAGASTLLVTCAGRSLGDPPLPVGTLALASDHVNLSGTSPLVGLGESRLGPRFPDVSALHDPALRRAALELCARMGLAGVEAVVACAAGPAIETPAERRWFARAGAQVSAQRLAAPLLCAAHAGLGALAMVVVTAAGDEPTDIARLTATSRALAPAIDDLVWELAGDLERRALRDLEEGTP